MDDLVQRAGDAIRRSVATGRWGPALAIVLGLSSIVEALVVAGPEDRPLVMLANLCVIVPLVFVDRKPVPAGVVATAFLFLPLSGALEMTWSAVLAELAILFVVASRTRRRVSILFSVPFLANAILPLAGDDASTVSVVLLVLVVASLALGDAQRLRGEAFAERDASRREAADALQQRAAMEERARIARELHDVVAHHVSRIAVQAEVGRVTDPDVSEPERERLTEIADTAREALREMRRVLGVLREDAGGGGERAPQPGLADLESLIDDARSAGTPVRFSLSGPVVALAPSVDLTGYRIVQEALTNVRRHAAGAAVEVELCYEPTTLHVRVSDEGPGAGPEAPDGHGLRGIRERVEMVGGSVRSGTGADGGFVVEAELPIEVVATGVEP